MFLGPILVNRYPCGSMDDEPLPVLRHSAGRRSILRASWIRAGIIILILLTGLGPVLGAGPPVPALPALRFPELEHDFGRVRGGDRVRHSFAVTNAGPGLLEISGVHASCSCVELGAWPSRLRPGEAGEIPFVFHTVNYSGPVTETLTVSGNDPPVILRLKADIWRPIDIRPAAAVFEYYPDDPEASVMAVRIVSHVDELLQLSLPKSSHPRLTAEWVPIVPGREFDLIVRALPPAKPANLVGTITLETSTAQMPLLEVPVHALVPPAIKVVPRTLRLPAGPRSGPMSGSVEIRNHRPDPLLLESPVINVKGASVTLTETVPGRRFTLVLTLPDASAVPTDGKAEITLKSNQPQFPVVRIPVVFPDP